MSDEIQKVKDLLFGMAYTESDGEELIALVTGLQSRAEAAEAELAALRNIVKELRDGLDKSYNQLPSHWRDLGFDYHWLMVRVGRLIDKPEPPDADAKGGEG